MPTRTSEHCDTDDKKSYVFLPLENLRGAKMPKYHLGTRNQSDVMKDTNNTKVHKWETSNIGVGPAKHCTDQSQQIDTVLEVLPKSLKRQQFYWISCSYRYSYSERCLDLTIRQTGCHPKIMSDPRFTKLSLEVELEDRWTRNCVLMKSKKDHSFKSNQFTLKNVPRDKMNDMCIKLKVSAHFGFLRRKCCVCRWVIPLHYCTNTEQTEFKRCSF